MRKIDLLCNDKVSINKYNAIYFHAQVESWQATELNKTHGYLNEKNQKWMSLVHLPFNKFPLVFYPPLWLL